ncbi:MAG TPA: AsnC family transcriptional regulator [Nitrososphaera sp.]|jgi:DNA-binding Lrp family transcriptional regulator|nr:AsnC family transcriptional regulator [Nitrososphaera sp.]
MSKSAYLSPIDRKLLKVLLTPSGKISSKQLGKKLGIPANTVQRRRKRLEKEFLTSSYSLNLHAFGWHKVDFLIATDSGKTVAVAKTLLRRPEVVYVGKAIGQNTIDLRVETVLKDNSEILRMMELLKGMAGVKDAMWSEIVEVVGRKMSIPMQIINQL